MKKTATPKPAMPELESDNDLPEGWALAPLGEVATLQRGFDLPEHQRQPGIIPVYAANGPVGTHSIARVAGPGVITGRSGTIGKVHFVEDNFWPLNTALYVKDFHGNDPQCIALLLRYFGLEAYHAGTGVPTLNRNVVHEVPVAVPPLEEQHRIVAKAIGLGARTDVTREHLAKVPKILKAFRQSVLAAACSGRLTEDWRAKDGDSSRLMRSEWIDSAANLDQLKEQVPLPESWGLSTIGRMGTEIQAGKNIRCDEHPPRRGEKGIVKISAVTWGEFNEEESKTLLDPSLFRTDRRINSGDLLISRANTLELVGACVIVGPITRQLMLSDKILRFQVEDDWKTWLLFCLRSSLGRFQIESLATGNQLSMRNISQRSLESIAIPLPPTAEQYEIVRRVEALFKLADTIEKRVEAATKRTDKLSQAILAKAFRGELVPTEAELARQEGRTYEPASVLLARIKAEREKAAVSANATKRGKAVAGKK